MKTFLLSISYLLCFVTVNAQDFSGVTKTFEQHQSDFNGHVIMIVKEKDSVIYKSQFGLATPETRVGIASASKWISASVILSLADQGYLSLDDSIGKYLPVFSKYGKGKPTIRQCLTHTSGFPAFANLPYKDLSLAMLVDSMAKYVSLKNVPGEIFEYGEMSYRIVGRVAEVATGKTWEQLFQDNIARKCNMTNTQYCWEKGNPAPGSGVCSTTSDYLNFLQMVHNKGSFRGEQVLSEQSVQEFFKSQISSEVQIRLIKSNPLIGELTNGKPISYGLGTWIYNYDKEKVYQSEVFCPGALGTFPFIDSCRGIYGVILTNAKIEKVVATELKAVTMVKALFDFRCQ